LRSAVAECRRLGITILPPDINRSYAAFAIETASPAASSADGKGRSEAAIRFGLASIKNVGLTPVEHMLSGRDAGGEFESIEDFCYRTDLRSTNKKVLESLIKVGVFDCLGGRKMLLDSVNKLISMSQTKQRARESGQVSMFDLWGQNSPVPQVACRQAEEDVSVKQKLMWERELLGVYFSQPLSLLGEELSSTGVISCGEINRDMVDEMVTVRGMVVSVRQARTKDNRPFVVSSIEDLDASIEVIAWPRLYETTQAVWQEGNIVNIKGVVKVRDGEVQLNGQEAMLLPIRQEVLQQKRHRHVLIDVSQSGDAEKDIEFLRKIVDVLKSHPGEDKVSLSIVGDGEATNLEMPDITVDYCPELAGELSETVGEGNFRLA
jgi:DNA polymerase-3 subunit alpha